MRFSLPSISNPKRAVLLVVALAAVAGVVAGREKPALEVIEQRAPRAELQVEIDLAKLERGESELPQSDPFAPRSFAPEQPRDSAPQKPAAPPLPFQYIGKVIENGKLEVYVTRGEELLSLSRGQKIGGEYRVDKISASSVTFTYLPLKMKQTLDLPAVN
ncbi:MAG: hypothetical protein ACREUN_04445 [Burkholderiales bacterium]